MGKVLLWVAVIGVGILALSKIVKAKTTTTTQRASLWDSGVGEPITDGDEQIGDQYLDTNTGNVYEFS